MGLAFGRGANAAPGASRAASWVARIACIALAFIGTTADRLVGEELFPDANWQQAAPADVEMEVAQLHQARDYALTGGGAGLVIRHGRVAMAWGDVKKKFDLKSSSKSIGVTCLGLAIADGKLRLDDPVRRHLPTLGVPPAANVDTGWLERITIRQLATQTAGFAKPGGFEPLLFEPGTAWHYSDGGPNWLADCVTTVYRQDLQTLMFARVLAPIGVSDKDLHWRKHAYRPSTLNGVPRREFGSGVHANVDAMARLGLLYLHRGRWRDRQLLPEEFVDLATSPFPGGDRLPEFNADHEAKTEWSNRYGDASAHYGLLWWNNADRTLARVPADAYWSWGLYDSLIVVIPSLDVVVARAGGSWKREPRAAHYDVLRPFLEPIVQSVSVNDAPRPRSAEMLGIKWSPRESIVRLAKGSDNWPTTWADDDQLYTAYGDGWGFTPMTEKKLSLGLARVSGMPLRLTGTNLRSESLEQKGQGAEGRKASGIVCVDGTFYMLIRNAGNSQLVWSKDRGATWTWADWKFATSFGCPTFVNYGRNYRGAPDRNLYVVSADSDSAYQPADCFVMARAPVDRVTEQAGWEFFSGDVQRPAWSPRVEDRTPIFRHAGACYRSGITFNAGLGRYLWCQTLPDSQDSRGPRFEGGFGVYESRRLEGPWSTVFFTRHWDVGPGETSRFPAKWISADGRKAHLLFSGDDCFSVRQAEFIMSRP
ncbi:MAG: serine hydrolase [Planctomycetales bacterium]|nr:serine hydrolase [Planctomycetales bacterium]